MSLSQKDDHTDVLSADYLASRFLGGTDFGPVTEAELDASWIDMSNKHPSVPLGKWASEWLSALHRIANADLRRCSPGWLQRIAMDALIATGQRVSDEPA